MTLPSMRQTSPTPLGAAFLPMAILLAASLLLCGCIGGSKSAAPGGLTMPPPVINTLAVSVDTGPAGATGAVNRGYVTVNVCAPGGTQCATIDHVLLDTGSWGLRLVGSVLKAKSVTLASEADSQGRTIEECATFGSGQTWGPIAAADVTLTGESAAKVPVQILDDTASGAGPPATCGASGTLINKVTDWLANGVLGIGVFAQDCGPTCVNAATPLPIYYGCTAAGVCTAENVALTDQVTNPATLFAADNNGVIISLPNLQNANGDSSVQGELIFGLGTQTDNALPPTGLTTLAADSNGDFAATYNGGTTPLPAMIDSGTNSYSFNDPSMAVCTSAAWVGFYCPAVAPQSVFAVNSSAASSASNVGSSTNTVDFAVADPNSFVATASAFEGLAGGGGSSRFTWGMPFFYGRKVYIGFEGKTSGSFTGPYYAY